MLKAMKNGMKIKKTFKMRDYLRMKLLIDLEFSPQLSRQPKCY